MVARQTSISDPADRQARKPRSRRMPEERNGRAPVTPGSTIRATISERKARSLGRRAHRPALPLLLGMRPTHDLVGGILDSPSRRDRERQDRRTHAGSGSGEAARRAPLLRLGPGSIGAPRFHTQGGAESPRVAGLQRSRDEGRDALPWSARCCATRRSISSRLYPLLVGREPAENSSDG